MTLLLADPVIRLAINIIIIVACLYLTFWLFVRQTDGKLTIVSDKVNHLFGFVALGTGANALIVAIVYSLAPGAVLLVGIPPATFYAIGDILGALPFVVGAIVLWRNRDNVKLQQLGRLFTTDLDQLLNDLADQKRIASEREQLLHLVSHDLSSPVSGVLSEAEYLLTVANDKDVAESLGHMIKALTLTDNRLKGLATYNKIKVVDFAHINTAKLIGELCNAMELDITEANGKVIYSQNIPWIMGSEVHVSHVFQNLISNGLRYRHPDRDPVITITARNQPEGIYFTVTDNGLGFAQEESNKIFNLYASAHQALKGTGIGLTICKRIIEQHGGSIRAVSDEGFGTSFLFNFPHHASKA